MVFTIQFVYSQNTENISITDPDGPASNAPDEILDFREMIGTCDCRSLRRNPDRTWADTLNMVWTFRYIMNGHAIQDETWIEDGIYATSIRQFDTEQQQWVVSYYSSNSTNDKIPVWKGNRKNNIIELSMPQKAPNGMPGKSRLTFDEISENGFNWRGEWVDENETVIYPFWLIWCKKRTVRN